MINKDVIFPIALITLSACLIVTSDTVMKRTMEYLNMDENEITNPSSIFKVVFNPYIIFAFVLGGFAKLIYSFAVSTHDISRMLTAMIVMVMLGYAIVGIWQFGETINQFKLIGILLGLVSIILLFWSE